MTNKQFPYAELLVVFLKSEDGGRQGMPILDDQGYRPHLRIIGTENLLGVEFIEGPDEPVKPDVPTYSAVRFLYHPQVSYENLQVGTKFEIVEGPNVVGSGEVTRR